MKTISVLKPIPEKEMPKWVSVASQAHKRATRKKRPELRRRGLPMIIWKDGKVREVPSWMMLVLAHGAKYQMFKRGPISGLPWCCSAIQLQCQSL